MLNRRSNRQRTIVQFLPGRLLVLWEGDLRRAELTVNRTGFCTLSVLACKPKFEPRIGFGIAGLFAIKVGSLELSSGLRVCCIGTRQQHGSQRLGRKNAPSQYYGNRRDSLHDAGTFLLCSCQPVGNTVTTKRRLGTLSLGTIH